MKSKTFKILLFIVILGISLITTTLSFLNFSSKSQQEEDVATLRVQETTIPSTPSTTLITSKAMTEDVSKYVLDHDCYTPPDEISPALNAICPNMIGDGLCDDLCNHPEQVTKLYKLSINLSTNQCLNRTLMVEIAA